MISLGVYTAGFLLAVWQPWLAIVLYVANSLAWFLPDRRIESMGEA
jgi:hypothetical protein